MRHGGRGWRVLGVCSFALGYMRFGFAALYARYMRSGYSPDISTGHKKAGTCPAYGGFIGTLSRAGPFIRVRRIGGRIARIPPGMVKMRRGIPTYAPGVLRVVWPRFNGAFVLREPSRALGCFGFASHAALPMFRPGDGPSLRLGLSR